MGTSGLLLASCGESDAPPPAGPCAGAVEIHFDESIRGDLAVTGERDFYSFRGKEGQVVVIDIDAQLLGDEAEYDPTYIDSVVTLYDAAGVRVAQNNNPIEYPTDDSRLYTILPSDGEYCVRVAECWTAVSNAFCSGKKDKVVTTYDLWLHELVDAPGDSISVEVEAGDDATAATTIEYGMTSDELFTFWGTFRDEDDIDVWSFTPPADLMLPEGVRAAGWFFINMPDGPNGSGSTAPTGRVWVAEAAAPDVVFAEVDASESNFLRPPLKLGTPYLIFVRRPEGEKGPNDFYFVRHWPGWGNPLEQEVGIGSNDTPATAEPLDPDSDGLFIEGDLAMGAQDVDYFVGTIPSGKKARASCGAQGMGSGLRGLRISLLSTEEVLLANGDPESETDYPNATIGPFNGDTQVILKVKADSQDAVVTGAFYGCAIRFIDP